MVPNVAGRIGKGAEEMILERPVQKWGRRYVRCTVEEGRAEVRGPTPWS